MAKNQQKKSRFEGESKISSDYTNVGKKREKGYDEDDGCDRHTTGSFSVAEKVCVLLNPI